MNRANLESISNNISQKPNNNPKVNSIVSDFIQKSQSNSRIALSDLVLEENRKNNFINLERQFLLAVERSDIASIKRFLDSSQKTGFNINCRDALGRNAILIAIEYEHIELLELLLKYDLDLGDALLHAINEENLEAVEIIINAQIEIVHDFKPSIDYTSNPSSSFTPDITPIILAAHRDNYEIIKLLLDRGDRIPKPHDLRCACDICVESQKQDSLRHSKSRINAYQALASPSLIALSSKDPILTAFELSWELKRLGRLENEFKSEYERLSSKCEDFARALLEQTRGSEELAILLNHSNGSFSNRTLNERNADSLIDTHGLARLKLAIKYNQKSFVAHPHCQQLLASLWYEGLPGFRRRPFLYKVGMIFGISAMFPMLATIYLIYPRSTVAGLMKKPFIKFICHSSSYMLFLLLLILAALRIEYNHLENDDYRGNKPTMIEWILMIYIAGFIWQEVKELWENGVKGYIMDMWNLLDFATNSLYVATISLRAVAYYRQTSKDGRTGRPNWDSYDPTLISECLFAAANIFSTLKLVYIFTVNPNLGPLQISLGRMLNDIMKFFLIYMLVLVAFACGLNQLLWFYAKKRIETCSDDKNRYFLPTSNYSQNELYNYCVTRGKYFTSLFEIVQSLYWSTYGLVDLSNLNLEYPHQFTEFVGKLMFGTYSFITLIVLLNMLIAMMNTSYQLIAEQADIEWKFARSKLWISYFEDGNTLPVPFNIIISPKTIYYLFFWFKMNCLCKSKGKKSRWHSIKKIVSKVNEMEQRYQRVMNNLIMRYLLHRQKAEENAGVTEDDLNEIKGDISAFRFELLDILKNNGMTVTVSSDRGLRSKLRRKGSKKSLSRLNQRFDTKSSSSTIDQLGSISEISTPLKSKKSIISSHSLEKSKTSIKTKRDKPKKAFSLEDEPSVSFAADLEIFAYESKGNSSKLSKVTNKLFSKRFTKKSAPMSSRSVPNITPNVEKNQLNFACDEVNSRDNLPISLSQPVHQYNLNVSSPTLNRIYFCQDNIDALKENRSKRSDLV